MAIKFVNPLLISRTEEVSEGGTVTINETRYPSEFTYYVVAKISKKVIAGFTSIESAELYMSSSNLIPQFFELVKVNPKE